MIYLCIVGLDYYVWIGGLRTQASFIWVDSGIHVNFTYWDDGQPNNYDGDQYCLHLELNKRWNDYGCFNRLYYVCEYFFNK